MRRPRKKRELPVDPLKADVKRRLSEVEARIEAVAAAVDVLRLRQRGRGWSDSQGH